MVIGPQITRLRFPEYLDIGLLIVRVCTGVVFMYHGYPKMFGGIIAWEKYGVLGMSSIGVDFFLPFWGFMAAFSEFIGGLFLLFGLFSRPALILIFLTMFFAVLYHINSGKGSPVSAMQWIAITTALFLAGSGKYSLDYLLVNKTL